MSKNNKQSKTKQEEKKRIIAEFKKSFMNPIKLEDIHYNDSCFFPDIVLWGIRPIRLLVDTIYSLAENETNTDAAIILLNELQIRLDNLIDHFGRWEREEIDLKSNKKAA